MLNFKNSFSSYKDSFLNNLWIILKWTPFPIHIIMWIVIWLEAYIWIPTIKSVIENFQKRHEKIIEHSPMQWKITSYECFWFICWERIDTIDEFNSIFNLEYIRFHINDCKTNCSIILELREWNSEKSLLNTNPKDILNKLPPLPSNVEEKRIHDGLNEDDIESIKDILNGLWYKWDFDLESIIKFISNSNINNSSLPEIEKVKVKNLYYKYFSRLKLIKTNSQSNIQNIRNNFFLTLLWLIIIIFYWFHLNPNYSKKRIDDLRKKVIEKFYEEERKYITSSQKDDLSDQPFSIKRKELWLQSFKDFNEFYWIILSLSFWTSIMWYTKDEDFQWKRKLDNGEIETLKAIDLSYYLEKNWITLENLSQFITNNDPM